MSSPITAPPLSYYLGLFTSLYKTAPKLNAWQTIRLQPLADIMACAQTITAAYDIDTAVGIQLDVLGQIIGANRTVPFQPSMGVSPVLDDSTYRLLLYAKRANNTWNGKILSLYPLWQTLFPSGNIIFIDNQNMTATIILAGTFSSIQSDLIENDLIVPRPEGVAYKFIVAPTFPLFGADLNNVYIAGADLGHASA